MPPTDATPYEPRRPLLAASGLLSFWVLILSLPMVVGRFVAVYPNDQYAAGYAFRHWLAEQIRTTGRIPLWNPELFGGLPFVAGMHGDIFYPTSWLRLLLPTHLAMDLGFTLHYILAGLFVYLLLRRLGTSWAGGVVGGLAYQLSGSLASLVSPGHDGKLFVSALLPLALIALVMAIRERRFEGYGLLALTVGLGILSPHYQMVYYLLIVAGLFAVYLTFLAEDRPAPAAGARALGLALGAVLLGFGIGAIQLLPFYHYVPFSPRAESYGGFEAATSYAIPWSHVPELFLAGFAGSHDTYWAGNPLKYHSEYLGLPVVALALFGVAAVRGRLTWWLIGVGALFLLIALGGATPFYQLWWAVMPMVKQTRAPGMALFVVAFVLAVFAAFGADRLQRGEGQGVARWWMGVGGAVLVLALAGVFGGVAESFAMGLPRNPYVDHVAQARDAAGLIRLGAFWSGLALLLLGALVWFRTRRPMPALVFALGLCAVVSADLWRAAAPFWRWSESPDVGLYAEDGITQYLRRQPLPFRVMDFTDSGLEVYPGSSLMSFSIPQLLGHHGNQLHAFNELMGGKNEWGYLLQSRRLWELFAVQYVLVPAGADLGSYPQLGAWRNLSADFDTVFAGVMASSGRRAHLLERRNPVPYARVVPGAAALPDDRAIPLVADPRSPLNFDQVVIVDPDAPVAVDTLRELPERIPARAEVTAWAPGHMRLRVDPAPVRDAWLVVAENWYPGWRGTVDGRPTPVVRGDVSLITVPLTAGAREVELRFESPDYQRGKLVTLGCIALVLAGLVAPVAVRRRRG